MNKILLSIIGLFTSCFCCCGQQKFKTIDADKFEQMIAMPDVQLVDVRTQEEYNEGHIKEGRILNLNVQKDDFMSKAKKLLDKKRPVAVYCRSGKRSANAANKLSAEGYEVIDLKGGILEWQSRGKKVYKDQE